jgi:hypothetical protein
MSASEFFTRVVRSYQELLSVSDNDSLTLRSYCRSRHVACRDFLRWAKTDATACGILKNEQEARKKQTCGKTVRIKRRCSSPSGSMSTPEQPLFYPLQIVDSATHEHPVMPDEPSVLRGILITLPGGVKITIREALVRELSAFVRSFTSH